MKHNSPWQGQDLGGKRYRAPLRTDGAGAGVGLPPLSRFPSPTTAGRFLARMHPTLRLALLLYDVYSRMPQGNWVPNWGHNMSGWTQAFSCPGILRHFPNNVSVLFCATNQNQVPDVDWTGNNVVTFWEGRTIVSPPFQRSWTESRWTRDVAGQGVNGPTAFTPVAPDADERIPLPFRFPQIRPQLRPPGLPALDPAPQIPWRYIPEIPANEPDFVPGERREVGPERTPLPIETPSPIELPAPGEYPPNTSPSPDEGPDTAPGTRPAPRTRVDVWTDPIDDLLPEAPTTPRTRTSGGVDLTILPPGHVPFVPPGHREKERKLIVSVPPGRLAKLIGQVTESYDMIECMHRALPKNKQAKRKYHPKASPLYGHTNKPSLKRKAEAVYRNLDVLDLPTVIQKCVEQQAMDVIQAAIGRTNALSARRARRSSGFLLGGSQRNQALSL